LKVRTTLLFTLLDMSGSRSIITPSSLQNASSEQKRTLKMVEELKQVHTADGMGRAWIRMLLTKNVELLQQCLQTLISNQTFTRFVVRHYAAATAR
jgi:hypothetical protein